MKNIIDDGYSSYLVENAFFDGVEEIPIIERPDKIVIPLGMVPFSQRKKSHNHEDFICFYEHDIKFSDVLTSTNDYLNDIKKYPGVITPDCSLYVDMPLCLQISNIYMNRAVGHYFQANGIYVIPNVRWGDERTFTTKVLPEKVAFLGLPKKSIVSIGTYGCIKNNEYKKVFHDGLSAMLSELEPEIVLVYGAMPDSIFNDLKNRTHFIQYPDWISRKRAVN